MTRGDGLWQAIGGKRPCDGCGKNLNVGDVQVMNTMKKLVFCKDCWDAWKTSLKEG